MSYRRCGKRLFDTFAAFFILVALSPLLAVTAWLVRRNLGSPVLFKQRRLGYKGHEFAIYKFRTMTDARGPDGQLLPDSERLTRFGRLLRSTSIDELPELLNVLRGEMSLVGPRPLLVQYRDRYSPEQFRRHDVLPGITGWAQINGRNAISWAEKFRLDVYYVDNLSLKLDLEILWKTVAKTLRREGISAPGHDTIEEFNGSN